MKRLVPMMLALVTFAGCAEKMSGLGATPALSALEKYIEILQPETIREGGRPKFTVQPGDELEILYAKPCICLNVRRVCWAVRDLLTGQTGFVQADLMRSQHRVSASRKGASTPVAVDGAQVGTPALSAEAQRAAEATYLLTRANAILENGGAREVVPLLKRADDLSKGTCAECLISLANAYYRMQRYDDVVATAERAIALTPAADQLTQAYNLVALGHQREGKAKPARMARAEEAYRRALELHAGQDAVLRYNLARLLFRVKRTEEANSLLQAVVSESPEAPVARRARLLLDDPACLDEDCAPSFSLTTLDGQQVSLESLRGKVVLLHFWASGCELCSANFPDLNRLAERIGKDPFFVVAVSYDLPAEALARSAKRQGLRVPLFYDQGAQLTRLFEVKGYPRRILIDHRGRVLSRTYALTPQDEMRTSIELGAAISKAKKALVTRAAEVPGR